MSDYTYLPKCLREGDETRANILAAADAIEALLETQRKFGLTMHAVMEERDRLREYQDILVRERNEAWAERDRLRGALAATQEDTARYRYLRAGIAERGSLNDTQADAAIDAAMAKEQK